MPFLVLLGVAFVLTGAAALVIEQALERLLSTVVGASADAGAIVLSIYFFGLAVGGVLYVRLRHRFPNGARLYALLEAFVGTWALLLGVFFSVIQEGSALAIQASGGSGVAVFLARLAVAGVWILPPTLAMGGSFPAVVQWLAAAHGEGRTVSAFYALNVAGALIGSTVAAYLLFPELGVRGGLITMGVVQLFVAALVFWRFQTPSPTTPPPTTILPFFLDGANRRWIVLGFASGLLVFSFEVLWIHLAGVAIGMSAYTFASVISVVLLGLFVGGTIVSAMPTRWDRFVVSLALAVASVGLVVAYPLWDDAPIWFLDHRNVSTFMAGELVRFRFLLVLVGVPSVGLGLVYPAILRSWVGHGDRDTAVATISMANGLGSLSGALLTGFVFVGTIGSEETYRLLTALMVVVGLYAALSDRLAWAFVVFQVAAVGILTLQPLWDRLRLTAGTNVYFAKSFVDPSTTISFWHEDNTGGITTIVERGPIATLLTNGKFQGNNSGETIDQIALAALPCLMTPARERALVIGLGTGQSAGVVHDFGFAHVDIAELSVGMVEAARVFGGINGDVLDQPNVTLHVEDGRNYLLQTEQTYDVISMEISSIWFAGAASLYSRDFYELTRRRLKPGGILQQWVQLHHIGLDEVASVIGSLRAAYPVVSLWLVGNQGVLIASDHEVTPDVTRMSLPALADERARLGDRLAQIPDTLLLGPADLDRFLASRELRLNTDANRYLEYASPRYNLVKENLYARNVAALRAVRATGAGGPTP
jgi:spermidine synthase